jgi:hypothetical protein
MPVKASSRFRWLVETRNQLNKSLRLAELQIRLARARWEDEDKEGRRSRRAVGVLTGSILAPAHYAFFFVNLAVPTTDR